MLSHNDLCFVLMLHTISPIKKMGFGWLLWINAAVIALVALNFINFEAGNIDIHNTQYDLKETVSPRLTGTALSIFSWFVHTIPLGSAVINFLLNENEFFNVRKFAAQTEEVPTFLPLHIANNEERSEHAHLASLFTLEQLESPQTDSFSFRYWSAQDYVTKYKAQQTTPTEVAKAFIKAVHASNAHNPPLLAVTALNESDVLFQAEASAQRYLNNQALGPLDGVLIVVKEEFFVYPYPTTVGTNFLGRVNGIATLNDESTAVSRLRQAGAIIAGKTNMVEIGIGTLGFNAHFGTPRNPYNTDHYTSGSSAGSGGAVGAGLVPIAIGADGGGSVRLPAFANGVVGLKPTFGRISEHGAYPLAPTVGHVGPLAATVYDAAVAYAIMAGPDADDRNTIHQPAVHVSRFNEIADLKDIRIGVYQRWNEHADADIVISVNIALAKLQARGATIVNITIPHLGILSKAHTLTIISELASAMDPFMREHLYDFGVETRVNLAIGRAFSSRDYIAAQQARTYFIDVFDKLFGEHELDVILTPTSGITIPFIPSDALDGASDTTVTTRLMRFAQLGNFVGLPALTVPFGFSSATSSHADLPLPIGIQIHGKHWAEDTILRVGHALEAIHQQEKIDSPSTTLTFGPRKPQVLYLHEN